MFKQGLEDIIRGKDLSQETMSQMITEILSGTITHAQIGAFMGALSTKGETYQELIGAARAMRRKATRIQTTSSVVLDTCGTGGDGASTFNISTTTAFVVAGCGVTVAKHGNRSVSSRCGSADLLEALGVNLNLDPEMVEEGICDINIGFLFAPLYHGAMKFAATARKEVGIRSVFNMLGPLTNPAGANCQLLGVYAPELTEMFARALQGMGTRRAFVVHGHDGLDEISLSAPTRISELVDGKIKTYDLMPEQFFNRAGGLQDLAGGSPSENADITLGILKGEKGPKRDVVLLNAGAALVVAGKAVDIREGIHLAGEAIDSCAAQDKLQKLIQFTRQG
ncbi:MAG: anthranilate phosphoribosyltransferase [Deltaproteobacteria bacterium]|jgi:anthranilate phosphoribosyltransferase|nr:anthranilate phosphoribosyltransferase [Deltaproteobacteria bacterium]